LDLIQIKKSFLNFKINFLLILADTQIPGSSQPELLVSVGPPASSKSTFAQKINERDGANYVVVNQDKLGTWKACLEVAKRALAGGKSVIIDNTNRDIETRQV
jgi:bifunctional polynucleotide phosphatase/kinase